MSAYSFESVLQRPPGVGAWTYFDIPLKIPELFGAKGQVKVKGTINGYAFRSSALPHGDGKHYIVVKQEIRNALRVQAGDKVKVTLELDHEVRSVDAPEDFLEALEENPLAQAAYARLSYSHQKQYVEWITGAKQDATRQSRIAKALEMLPLGLTPKGRGG